MNTQIQTTSIIRQRGQLTIPKEIRKKVSWLVPGSVVTMTQMKPDEIIVRPYQTNNKKIDWDKIWKNIELARSYKGKYRGSLSNYDASFAALAKRENAVLVTDNPKNQVKIKGVKVVPLEKYK